jgi:hypothetical protein
VARQPRPAVLPLGLTKLEGLYSVNVPAVMAGGPAGLVLHLGRDCLEFDRSAASALKKANALADEDRSHMHDDLV